MIIDELIKNYYELHGNFDGILQTGLRDEVLRKTKENSGKLRNTKENSGKLRNAKENSENLTKLAKSLSKLDNETPDYVQECYRVLGFGNGKYSPAAEACLLAKCFESKGNNKVVLSTRKEFGINAMSRKPLVIRGVEGLDRLVAEYYRKNDSIYVKHENGVIPFNAWVLFHRSMKIEKMLQKEEVKPVLVKSVVREGVEPMVYQGTLILPFDITEKELFQINTSALAIVSLKQNPAKELANVPIQDLLILSKTDPKKYLKFISYAKEEGITFADILSWFGVYELNLMKVYQETGFLVYFFDSFCLVYKESIDGWVKMRPEEFLLFVQQKANKILAADTTSMSGF